MRRYWPLVVMILSILFLLLSTVYRSNPKRVVESITTVTASVTVERHVVVVETSLKTIGPEIVTVRATPSKRPTATATATVTVITSPTQACLRHLPDGQKLVECVVGRPSVPLPLVVGALVLLGFYMTSWTTSHPS